MAVLGRPSMDPGYEVECESAFSRGQYRHFLVVTESRPRERDLLDAGRGGGATMAPRGVACSLVCFEAFPLLALQST